MDGRHGQPYRTAVTSPDDFESEAVRVRVADRNETIANGWGRLGAGSRPLYGSTPDGWPMILLDAGTHDIYALDWDAP